MAINKKELFYKCLDAINKRIQNYQNEMDLIKESMDANDIHTDYDEDNKGKLLADFEKNANFLSDAQKMKETLRTINVEHYTEEIGFGSLVETNKNYYFISVSVGEIIMEGGSMIYAISIQAPIYKEFKGKKAGDSIVFKNESIDILNVR